MEGQSGDSAAGQVITKIALIKCVGGRDSVTRCCKHGCIGVEGVVGEGGRDGDYIVYYITIIYHIIIYINAPMMERILCHPAPQLLTILKCNPEQQLLDVRPKRRRRTGRWGSLAAGRPCPNAHYLY